jgi:hydantoinase/carbamoylase family amidase
MGTMYVDHIDIDRIERRLEEVWAIGKTDQGGVTRPAYSEKETEAHEYIVNELPDAYETEVDRFGNLYATREPDSDQSLYIGSHLDTVYDGGKFDGAIGVITALEAMEAVYASDQEPAVPPTLTVWRAEEPPRFGKTNFGCRGAMGRLTEDDLDVEDDEGISVREAMERCGFPPTNLTEPSIDLDRMVGFLESHNEQARVLESVGENVGVVTSIRAPVRHRITVTGNYDHSGATPMDLRQDALVGASRMINSIYDIATDASEQGDLVATVGDIEAVNGQITAVCGKVTFPIDLRSNDLAYRNKIEQKIHGQLQEIASGLDLSIDIELIDRNKPVELDSKLIELLDDGASELGIEHRLLPSGAGHDSRITQLAGVPTAMLFAPSIDGISHNPDEDTPIEAVEDVTKVFAHALVNYGSAN